MKTKILELIDKFIEIEKRYDAVYTVDTFKELRQEIEEMQEQSQWIPVTERQPNNYESVLLFRKDSIGANAIFTSIWDDESYFKSIGVTHWQPLPLPPHPSSHD